MKKGLLIWGIHPGFRKNIGDYIQSIAAEQYTGRDVVYIERELINEYAGEPVKMIMNGWFMHHPENWPPSEAILPLFTSIHMTPAAVPQMLSEKAVAYFKNYVKKYGPVGARDKGTERNFKAKGIDAYFSGCLTLTLGKTYQHNPRSERICFVDAHYDVPYSKRSLDYWACRLTLLLNKKTITDIAHKLMGSVNKLKMFKAAAFYRTYSQYFDKKVLEDAEYICHLVQEAKFESEEAKFTYARNLLDKYANSRLVVTSRIHAALPCLAMDTPTIFVISDDLDPNGKGVVPKAKGRFDGLLELFHVMENLNFRLKPILGFKPEKKIGVNHSIRNKENHLKIVEELDKQCKDFIQSVNQKSEESTYSKA